MRKLFVALAALALVSAVSAEDIKSGPAAGTEAPLLHVDAFNDGAKGKYCVTCEAKTKPAVVAFISTLDDNTKALLAKLETAYVEYKPLTLYAGVVITSTGEQADALKAYITEQKLTVPTAVGLSNPTGEGPAWAINKDAGNTVIFITKHKVKESYANLSADKVPSLTEALVK